MSLTGDPYVMSMISTICPREWAFGEDDHGDAGHDGVKVLFWAADKPMVPTGTFVLICWKFSYVLYVIKETLNLIIYSIEV